VNWLSSHPANWSFYLAWVDCHSHPAAIESREISSKIAKSAWNVSAWDTALLRQDAAF
jgi:hypothetical protein